MSQIVEKCVCGHEKYYHMNVSGMGCWACPDGFFVACGCKRFKLDNLTLIEDLAKERSLV
jgi:hypothetical protein